MQPFYRVKNNLQINSNVTGLHAGLQFINLPSIQAKGDQPKQAMDGSSADKSPTTTRWTPTKAQKKILIDIFGNHTQTPSCDERQRIFLDLQKHGPVEQKMQIIGFKTIRKESLHSNHHIE